MTVWFLVVVSVQPWARVATTPQGQVSESGSLGKGVLLGACLGLVLIVAPRDLRLRVPSTWLFLLAYVATAFASSLLLLDPLSPGLRIARILLGLLIPLALWSILRVRPRLLLRAHLWAHLALAASVVVGMVALPGLAWQSGRSFGAGGRLVGALLPMLAPRVGEVGAVVAGLVLLALVFRRMRVWVALPAMAMGLSLIVLSRTRTAAAALVLGVLVAFLWTAGSRQGRRGLLMLLVAGVGVLPFAPAVMAWAVRQQSPEALTSLSGRTVAWEYIVSQKLPWQTMVFGHGLGNKKVLFRRGDGRFDVMPIDNSWLSLYWETGLMGVVILAAAVLSALWLAARAPTPYVRASTLFLLVYVVCASLNESGLSDLSSLLLHVMVAAMVADLDRRTARGARRRRRTVPGTLGAPAATVAPPQAASLRG